MGRRNGFTRRHFLARAGAGLAAPYFLTGEARGSGGAKAASDRVVVGVIGTGGQGRSHLAFARYPRSRIAAVCDVDQTRLANARRTAGHCDAYGDFRRIIDRSDIDAVTTATPDHWHALITILGCQAGKDVYSEKPLALTVAEGRAMVRAARRYSRVVQMGTQYRSNPRVRQVCEWLRNGRIGTVGRVRVCHPPNRHHPLAPPQTPPATLDWDMWLGPAPWAPYHPRRCHFSFRWFMDYAGGYVTDNGVHMFSIVSWAMGTDATGPVTIEATGRGDPTNLYDVPVEMRVTYQFADPRFTMTWEQPGGGGIPGLVMQYIGSEGTLTDRFGNATATAGVDLSPTRSDEAHLHRSNNHHQNWLDCIASRARPACDVEIGHRVTSWSHLGNIAYRTGRRLAWDPVRERFRGDDEANRLLSKPFREPWFLPL